nr:hypothetical protein [Tanacetum cinerariifolium]
GRIDEDGDEDKVRFDDDELRRVSTMVADRNCIG